MRTEWRQRGQGLAFELLPKEQAVRQVLLRALQPLLSATIFLKITDTNFLYLAGHGNYKVCFFHTALRNNDIVSENLACKTSRAKEEISRKYPHGSTSILQHCILRLALAPISLSTDQPIVWCHVVFWMKKPLRAHSNV